MKILPFLLLLPLLVLGQTEKPERKAVEFIGDKSTKKYYPFGCDELSKISVGDDIPLFGVDDAKEKGFSLGEKCTQSKVKATVEPTKSAPVRRNTRKDRKYIKSILQTQGDDRNDYIGRMLWINNASLSVSDGYYGYYAGRKSGYHAYVLSDNTGYIHVYMLRGGRYAEFMYDQFVTKVRSSLRGSYRFEIERIESGYFIGKLWEFDAPQEEEDLEQK